jgi:hypothetical protein
MGNKALILALALILLFPLCLNAVTEKPSVEEQRFINDENELLKARADLPLESKDYTKIRPALLEWNLTVHRITDDVAILCNDKNVSEKNAKICSQTELFKRCNIRDVEFHILSYRLIYDRRGMTKTDCNELISITNALDECETLDSRYLIAQKAKDNIKTICNENM